MEQVTLTSSMRTNLLSLKRTASLLDVTENRLSTGQKINSALDGPSSFYTAKSLTNRASDLMSLLDAMGQGVQTIKAATQGVETATSLLEQMQSIANQTLSDSVKQPLSNVAELTNNVEELLAQGYQEINSDMSYDEIQARFNTDGAKLVLTSDIIVDDDYFAIEGAGVTLNGGGHIFKYNYLELYGSNVTIENIRLESSSGLGYIETQNFTLKNAEIVMNGTGDYATAINFCEAGGTIENVDIKISGDTSEFVGIYLSNEDVNINRVSMSFQGRKDAIAVGVNAQYGSAVINGIGIDTNAKVAYAAITGENGAIEGVELSATHAASRPSALYDGKANTAAIVGQLGEEALAAYATTQFYVDVNGEHWGEGDWYLPSIGELMEMYGTDTTEMTEGYGTSGAAAYADSNMKKINDTLTAIGGETMYNKYYWSSSEYNSNSSWRLNTGNGYRSNYSKDDYYYVRSFQLLENGFDSSTLPTGVNAGGAASEKPNIADVVYINADGDLAHGTAAEYNSAKSAATAAGKKVTALGVVTWVSDDGKDVKIVNLKDYRFNSYNQVGNFNPANPYSGSSRYSQWSTGDNMYDNIKGVEDYADLKMLDALNPSAIRGVSVADANAAFAEVQTEAFQSRFNRALEQYDSLIQDSSYKGINLLSGNSLSVTFNETRDSKYTVSVGDISSMQLGLNPALWETMDDVLTSMNEVSAAINKLRSVASDLGTSYTIIQTRQNFTENLINVLQEGADNLTLADMNEESANMLALQTRQMLGVNSLSLAAQAAQSVLQLF